MLVGIDVNGQGMDLFTEGSIIMDYKRFNVKTL